VDVLSGGKAVGCRLKAVRGGVAWLRGLHAVWKWKRNMDDIDRAQQNQLDDINRALRNRTINIMEEGVSPLLCEDCDGEIPAARRAAAPGCTRCIRCQREFEAREGR